ncbi:MAG TPA: acetate uptake transporter [Bradyrhizobium sp.]|nr:acetate uptake transporter [Bradyrhizobium sp.]
MAQLTQLLKHESWTKSGPVVSRLPEEEIESLEDRAMATIADPAPLGWWGFATGTWIVGTVLAGVFPLSALTATIPVLVVFAGIAQFIAGLFAFRRANMLAATAFCSFGSFYALTGMFLAMQARGILPTTGDPMVLEGFVLLSFGFIALALMFAALSTNAALVITLGLLAVGFILTGITHLPGEDATSFIAKLGGWFLVASAFFAYYTGMALVVNSSWHRTVLPIGGEP